jgi:hypothetical protein
MATNCAKMAVAPKRAAARAGRTGPQASLSELALKSLGKSGLIQPID